MKQKFISSAYAKMYMVSPGVYQKLLNCINDSDKNATLNLNKPEVSIDETDPTIYPLPNDNFTTPTPIIENETFNNTINESAIPGPSNEFNEINEPPEIIQNQSIQNKNKSNILATPCESGGLLKRVRESKDTYGKIKKSAFIRKPNVNVNFIPDNEVDLIENAIVKKPKPNVFSFPKSDVNNANNESYDEDKEIRVYDCDICKKRFFNKWSVTRHKKNKHKIQNNPLTSTPTHESGNYSWNWNEPEIMEPGNLLPTGGIKRKIDYTNFPVTTRVYPIKRKKDKKTFEDWGYPVYSKK